MIERRRRTELMRKAVAAVALIASLGIGVTLFAGLWTQIFGGGARPTAPVQRTTTTAVAPPPENIRPLQVRPVQDILSPDQCPAEGQTPTVAPTDVLTACDFARSATYVLGPQAMELQLTHVETVKSSASEFYAVRVTMSPSSAASFAAYTAQQVGNQVAFIRDGVVVFAPKITQVINSQGLEISGNMTQQQASDVERLLRKPA